MNGERIMTKQDIFAYQDTMASVTKDIHAACPGFEFSVLWDDSKMRMNQREHKVKITNNLGSVEFRINHDDLLERGDAYKGFLTMVATRVQKGLGV
jgi:hypothetical protein